jgi:hypothetical protein
LIDLRHAIVTEDLGMRQVATKSVPPPLTTKQEENCLFAATDLLQCTESDADFLGNIIIGNETCIYSYDPDKKGQSLVGKSPLFPQPKKLTQVQNELKC